MDLPSDRQGLPDDRRNQLEAADTDPRAAVENAARTSYGRLVAYLSSRTHDLAAAEDALADAFRAALERWPADGIPERPEAWLLTAARRRLIDRSRRQRSAAEAVPTLLGMIDDAVEEVLAEANFPDERLKLLFVCAHPAIDAAARTPLMLQTVLGLDAAAIAGAFVVKPATMGQRLSRAKAKIRIAKIAFEVPEPRDLADRLDAVLDAIYAAYGSGWNDVAGADPRRRGLAEEAIELGRLLVQLMPDQPEAAGLLALMLFCESRRAARRTQDGAYVPLSDQDTALWSGPMIDEARRWLAVAEARNRLGHFQLEAAIQSIHVARAWTGRTDWRSVALYYEGLARLAPTVGVMVGRAAALAEANGPESGWAALQLVPEDAVATYQPYWALAAHLLRRLGRTGDASSAYERAIGLCEEPAMRDFLRRQMMN